MFRNLEVTHDFQLFMNGGQEDLYSLQETDRVFKPGLEVKMVRESPEVGTRHGELKG